MGTELTWWGKAGIGALGGFGLAVLKLIDAKFFLGNVSSTEATAAYLTYFCYMILGSMVAVFLTDHDLPVPKIKRSSFVLGLLAPSVLLAIASQPVKQNQLSDEGIKNIPKLSSLFLPSAYAEEPIKPEVRPTLLDPKVITITKEQLEPSFGSAILSAVGRTKVVAPHVYVVGTTTDKHKAVEASKRLNQMFEHEELIDLTSYIVKPEGANDYFITIGNMSSPEKIMNVKSAARSVALKTLTEAPSSQDEKQTAALLLEGKIVQAWSLIPHK